ncbi:type VI secretion system accessory protein TagJ [Pseudoxanthomonas putridarboris]|uniref:Type VI secretion system accessory protein TagJ n=1 Tax=Pseudoxanthomonas putridarboris TaxID=752605 RepID=A0ABU9J5Q3_9GAMM
MNAVRSHDAAAALLKSGAVEDAMRELAAQVRRDPANAALRVFLFQLLSVLGQWDRARDQLRAAGELDPRNALLANAYNVVLDAERERGEVLAGAWTPTMIGQPAQWQAQLLQALRWNLQGHHLQASRSRSLAFEQAEAIGGSIDGTRFEWIADADPRFGPCLEIVLRDGYAWVPFSQLRELSFEPPQDLRDVIWAPVQVTWADGGRATGFVPGRYPATERAADGDLLLARRTGWTDIGGGYFVGSGQRMLATDAGDYPLLDARTLVFDAA